MANHELKEKIKSALPSGSIGRYDLLPLFANAGLFSEIVEHLASSYIGNVDFVASPEATGWILGVALARELGVGFIALRKGGKLPYPEAMISSMKYFDYSKTEKSLELRSGSLLPGSRILIADEWIETGSSVRCCIELLEKEGCVISGLATIGIDYNENTKLWVDTNFATFIGRDI